MHSCAEAGWKRKRSWKYEKLFHNFNQIFGQGHRGQDRIVEKITSKCEKKRGFSSDKKSDE